MKIAIIGATGMLGHHTALAAMAHGHELVVIHREGSDLQKIADLSASYRCADLQDGEALADALSGVNGVIHCAGYYPTVPRPWREDLSRALAQEAVFYEACRQAQVDKIVYVGAAIALRRHPLGEPGHETLSYAHRPGNRNPYLQVKWAMDDLALRQARQGLPISIAIPGMTFGEYDYGPTTGRLITEVANATLPGYVDGKRNCIYAGDAGEGIVRVLEDGREGERYLLTGENTTMRNVVEKVAQMQGLDAPRSVPLLAAKMMARIQSLKYRYLGAEAPRISDTAIAVMSSGQFLSGNKAEQELGFKAHLSLDETLMRTLKWFKKVGYVGDAR